MSVLSTNYQILCSNIQHKEQQQQQQLCSGGSCLFVQKSKVSSWIVDHSGRNKEGKKQKHSKRDMRVEAFWPDLTRPTSVDMEHISDCDQLDQILSKAQQLNQPLIIDWMAAWCRKCIYLKPKLEKLAAEYDTKMKFYYVDVNKVSQSLVKRGNVSKMPTIQLWKDGEMKEEVIGGHKAWLVVEEVREMINKFI